MNISFCCKDDNAGLWMGELQAALPQLKANGGSVVLFSTVAIAQGFANHASIAMAKGAVEGLTLSLAAELAPAAPATSAW